ncbi:MAG TPA: outer membrane beta-barrel protein [Pseudomonadales bacterium]|nr:outer membrane beta-barrel protein [Pseudomonadales bacterium]
MKKYLPGITQAALVLGSAGLVFGATVVHADDFTTAQSDYKDHGFYVGGDVGVNIPSKLINDWDTSQSTTLNAGPRVDLTVGYAFKLSDHFLLAPEFEVGVAYNTFGNGDSNGQPTSGGGNIVQVPVLINGVLTYKVNDRWSVYGGVGLGMSYMDVSVSDNSPLTTVAGDGGGIAVDAKLGVQFRLGPGELGLGYEYMENGNFNISTINNHTIEASYTIHF